MAEQTESQIKKPLAKTEQIQTTESVEKGTTQAIKKALPKVTNALGTAVTAPVKFIGDTVINAMKDSSEVVAKPISKGFEKIKDLSNDLIVDLKDSAKDVLDPGAVLTMMTGSPLLGSMISQTTMGLKDAFTGEFGEVYDDLKSKSVNKDSAKDSSGEQLDVEKRISKDINNTSDLVNTGNILLSHLISIFRSFSNSILGLQKEQIEQDKLSALRLAESERERLANLSKQRKTNTTDKKPETGLFEGLKANLLYWWTGLKSIFLVLGKGFKFLLKKAPLLFGVIEFFRSILSGEDIIKSLTNAGGEILKTFISFFTIPIDLIGKAFGKNWNVTEWFNDLISNIFDGISAILHGNWDEVIKIGEEKFKYITKVFEDIFLYVFDWFDSAFNKINEIFNGDLSIFERVLKFFEGIGELVFKPIVDFYSWIGTMTADLISKSIDWIKSKLPSWLGGSDDKEEKEIKEVDPKFAVSKQPVEKILERSKQITEIQTPIQTTIINNNTNNMTQMSNNNAVGKTNMIIQSSLRNMDPTFNQSLMSSYIPNM